MRITLFILLILVSNITFAQVLIDAEFGKVFTGYNDVRVPGDVGTEFSFSEDLESKSPLYYRLKLGYKFYEKHSLTFLFAPLEIKANGRFDKNVSFVNETFTPEENIEGIYRFDSYRLSYNYLLINNENINLGLGLTAKIRDAEISLSSGDKESSKTNTGFVPLINFIFNVNLSEKIALLIEGDALAAPQGRAEDVLFAFTYSLNPNIRIKGGYRILEGGADNDEVYNFTLINYAAVGLIINY